MKQISMVLIKIKEILMQSYWTFLTTEGLLSQKQQSERHKQESKVITEVTQQRRGWGGRVQCGTGLKRMNQRVEEKNDDKGSLNCGAVT